MLQVLNFVGAIHHDFEKISEIRHHSDSIIKIPTKFNLDNRKKKNYHIGQLKSIKTVLK